MKPQLFLAVLLISVTSFSQSKKELFKKVETLLNKVKGEKTDAFLSSDRIIKEQMFQENNISYTYKDEESTTRIEYFDFSWKDYFYPSKAITTNDNGVVLLKLKFRKPLKFYYHVNGSKYWPDGSKLGPKDIPGIELYCFKTDYEEIKGLINKIAEL